MIEFSFHVPDVGQFFGGSWDLAGRGDPATLDEMTLRRKCFGVRAPLVVNGVEVLSSLGNAHLADLALSLRDVVRRLISVEDASFDLTEDVEVIHLRNAGSLVVITSSAMEWQARAERDELVPVLAAFVRDAHDCLTKRFPGLADNPVIQRFAPV